MLSKLPKWTPIHSSDIQYMSWRKGILRVRFDHPLYYYRYQNVPEDLFWLFLAADASNLQHGVQIDLEALFRHTIKNHPNLYQFNKMILPKE